MEKMSIYEALRNVPENAQKKFNNGKFSGTDINPMWRIKKMTEQFGACGIGWYYEVLHRDTLKADDGTFCTFIGINLYVKVDDEWSKPIYGEGGNTFSIKTKSGYLSVSDEAYKMALTDALSNATKQLGLGADIWFEKDKVLSTKYDLQQQRKAEDKEEFDDENALAVIDYLANNEKAGRYYADKYKVKYYTALNEKQFIEIYNELKKNKRI